MSEDVKDRLKTAISNLGYPSRETEMLLEGAEAMELSKAEETLESLESSAASIRRLAASHRARTKKP